jgi:predicted anti-sigma-YlaC factor YlaD
MRMGAMLSCKDVTEHASRWHDGEGGLRFRLMLRLHLLICVHCRRYLAQFAATIRLVRALPETEPAVPQMDALFAALRRPGAVRPADGSGG